jgi:monoamine oxidase
MVSDINRREFLSAGATMALIPSLSFGYGASSPDASSPKKVIIAGGGLAGLTCAYELRKLGFQVVVLEGQGHPGGRVHTLREGFAPGITAETGATRIPDTHDLTMSYIHEFGLPLDILSGAGLAAVVHLRGQSYVVGRGPEPVWPLPLTPEERRLGRGGLFKRYFADPLQQLKGKENIPSVPEEILALDHTTVVDYLRKEGLSEAAIQLMMGSRDNSTVSYALLLLIGFNSQVSKSYFHIRGGNDLLPSALALKLGDVVRYGCRVTSIGQDDQSAWAHVATATGQEALRGDYVVSTLPFSVSRNLFAEAHLSAEKQRAIHDLQYAPLDKVFMQMRKQFWKAQGKSGHADTDLEPSDTFSAIGPESPDERGLLLSTPALQNARMLDRMEDAARIKVTLEDAERVFPGARQHFETARVKSWALDPWQNGALPKYDVGQLRFIAIGARREGRISFAGEHTSRWNGWMQGAIESAHRVVKEIANRDSLSA